MPNSDIELSKTLSWLLRHAAIKEGLNITSDGFIKVDEILNHRKLRGRYTIDDIQRVVTLSDKQRFTFRRNSDGILEIRANQGHSLKEIDELELIPVEDSIYDKDVIHGTYYRCLKSIKKYGLSRMKRNHIHFATGLPNNPNIISGIRKNAQIFVYIDVKKAIDDGIKFYQSTNGVILSSGNKDGYIEPKYFKKLCKLDGTVL